MKRVLLALSLLLASVVSAEPNGGCNFVTGSPSCVAFGTKPLVLGTEGTGRLNFVTNNTVRGYIDGSTGAWTSMTLASPTISGTLSVGALAGASPITVSPGTDANRLFSFAASSDTAHALTFGDAGTTAAQTWHIGGSTADADDDSIISIGPGSTNSSTRGAGNELRGNEASGAGDHYIWAGNVAGGDIIFQTLGATALTISGSTNTDVVFGKTNTYFRANTSDASDDSRLILTGAGNVGDANRGSYIVSAGNEYSGGGDIDLVSGNSSGSAITLNAKTSSGILFYDTDLYRMGLSGGNLTFDATNGGDIVFNRDLYGVRQGTSDGSDDRRICLSGGGACSNSRGARLELLGNELGSGYVQLSAGSANGDLYLDTGGSVTMRTVAGSPVFTFNTSAGTLVGAGTGSIGWAVVDGSDNTACTSQCTSAAVFGLNLAAGATAPVMVGPSDATADICLCAGAS